MGKFTIYNSMKVNVLSWSTWLYRTTFAIFTKTNKKGLVFLPVFLFDNLEVLDIHLGSWQFQTMINFPDCNPALSY